MLYSFKGLKNEQQLLILYKGYYFKKHKFGVVIFWILALVFLFILFVKISNSMRIDSCTFIEAVANKLFRFLAFSFFSLLLIILPLMNPKTATNNTIKQAHIYQLPNETSYYIYDSCIDIITTQSTERYYWNQVMAGWHYRNIVAIQIGGGIFHFSIENVPEPQRSQFIMFLQTKIPLTLY